MNAFLVAAIMVVTKVHRWHAGRSKTLSVEGPLNSTERLIYGMGRLAMSRGTLSIWGTR